ncbi:MAG: ribbon-helix-helix domain-containing protein [Thermofilaceae archaeon]|nr:ribbon-helix-helix domain-containing protein [Thermofilaceae archaeon]MDW8004943.1 ribbon-helix-helix domain-containing protein [Thermofilaceae archaeon]
MSTNKPVKKRVPKANAGPIVVRLPYGVLERIDRLIEANLFSNRSEFVRFAVLRLLTAIEESSRNPVVALR